ncbi:MAG: microcin ABC transporter permease, partial [Pseudomonadota bacterium]
MAAYLIKRILLIFPTLLGIMLISFAIVQLAPGGPIERIIAQVSGNDVSATSRISGGQSDTFGTQGQSAQAASDVTSKYRGAQGLDPEFIKELEQQFGFDKPAHERFFLMMKNYLMFDFGRSYFRDVSVIDLIVEKLPVSISLGLWMTIITYLISIPLGIRKAVRDGEPFDAWTSGILVIGYAIPGFLIAVLTIVLFAGGSFLNIFPSRGLGSENWEQLSQLSRS